MAADSAGEVLVFCHRARSCTAISPPRPLTAASQQASHKLLAMPWYFYYHKSKNIAHTQLGLVTTAPACPVTRVTH